ncbi:DUF3139 domain-containing protein [Virgibacillus natechei]|nr:DUF3139 domain-containing protein [Virgibacillus natechei]UZD13613.1 DUF3139 domain-containing protein [Virgibacillus natechei]
MKAAMKISIWSLIGLLIVFILGFAYYLYEGNPWLRSDRMEQVENYIVETGGDIDNIKEMESRWLTSSGDYDINVVFEDEPELTYVYLYNDNEGGVILTGIFEGEPFQGDRQEEGKNGSLEEDDLDHN